MSDSQNICLSCGLCCDGTLIGFVELDPKEISRVKKVKQVEEAHGDGFFLQPCDKFCNGCTIYEERPSQCAQFECGLLQSVENSDLTFKNAKIIVEKVKQRKASIKKQVEQLEINLKSPSFYFQMTELKSLMMKEEENETYSEEFSSLKNQVAQLDQLVMEAFDLSKF